MGRTVILYRDIDLQPEELAAMQANFPATDSRMDIKPGDLVISRYSCLPFYREQENDINRAGARLINTFSQHNYIADMRNWYGDLEQFTPKTWFRPEDVEGDGPFVLKGKTNSKKFLWDTHMFARNRKSLIDVYCRLLDDTLIGEQDIYIRQYVPLHTYMVSLHGLPITKEFRFFILNRQLLCGAYYWSSCVEDLEIIPDVNEVPYEFLRNLMDAVGDNAPFYVADVAQTQEGQWILVELNDGQQSGLSENNPNTLYRRIREVLTIESLP